ncbi:C-C motif chemokine 22-like [Cottoperca gobio]|uniref:C-C motif chemokine 22-like n=1 Tax=Cottoperca gobio TaxID=56716 RepID=A0A6J2PG94_COTGO|nr:C-C motif chemokine 22-like [Cottoperca gobio]
MKTLVTLVLLICFLRHSSDAQEAASAPKDGCCQGYSPTPIPKRQVRHVGMTPSDCHLKAVVITTVCEIKVCVDPEWQWTKNLLARYKKSLSKCRRNVKKK